MRYFAMILVLWLTASAGAFGGMFDKGGTDLNGVNGLVGATNGVAHPAGPNEISLAGGAIVAPYVVITADVCWMDVNNWGTISATTKDVNVFVPDATLARVGEWFTVWDCNESNSINLVFDTNTTVKDGAGSFTILTKKSQTGTRRGGTSVHFSDPCTVDVFGWGADFNAF
jgi:hypothetical protein